MLVSAVENKENGLKDASLNALRYFSDDEPTLLQIHQMNGKRIKIFSLLLECMNFQSSNCSDTTRLSAAYITLKLLQSKEILLKSTRRKGIDQEFLNANALIVFISVLKDPSH